MEVPKKRRPLAGDGNDEAEILGPIVDSMAANALFLEFANIPAKSMFQRLLTETVSKPAKPTLLSRWSRDYRCFALAKEVYRIPICLVRYSCYLVKRKRLKRGHGDNVYKDPQRTLVGCLPLGLILNLTLFHGGTRCYSRWPQANKMGQYRAHFVLISMLVRRHGRNYPSRRCRFVDYAALRIISKFVIVREGLDKLGFNREGLSGQFQPKTLPNVKKVLLVDVDRCTPMMWGKDHWVGLVINLTCRQVEILTATFP
ncbi:hypothetical protein Bca52824_039976 [Brassica carinata]|uniref:Ubiquitin-like protease family profile domain-containing protein n=1 Tax=Brassica carinata TaxID=52824 RepID=A0A8X7RSI3_BRACI|nr:hypothetical protein Bca52824_039976 [Brassica carinata]